MYSGGSFTFIYPDPLQSDGNDGAGGDVILAPMPGQIKVINVADGGKVQEGDPLLVLEAMKMEHTLCAPRDGVVEEVTGQTQQQVESGAVLIKLEPS